MLLGAGMLATAATSTVAGAQGKLEAHYTVTLAGIPIGKGDWIIDISDTHYKATANGATTGLVRVFTGGQGTSVADGTLLAGKPMSAVYTSTITSRKKTDAVRIKVNNGDVKEFKVDPPQDNESERVPLTAAHRHNVLDPMTASLFRASGNGKPLSKDACQRTVAVFDGRMRYDLQLAFKRMDAVKADQGYSGEVVVCAIYFMPVAGYIPSRSTIKYIAKQRDMEVWLAPIAGTRVLVPIRAQSPTPIGEAVLKATQFVTSASSTRASANRAKTQ
jgi:Protein of unknown function (DUF3108)